MKILFIGDYEGVHAAWAKELRKHGHRVTIVSDTPLRDATADDIQLQPLTGFAGNMKYLFKIMGLLPDLSGYDVVQLVNPEFLALNPGKLAYFFRELKKRNGKICLTLASPDHFFVKSCLTPGFFRFSPFRIGAERTQFSKENRLYEERLMHPQLEKFTSLIYENVDSLISTGYEYHVSVPSYLREKLHYVGLPVDLSGKKDSGNAAVQDGKVLLFAGTEKGKEVEEGTDRLLDIALSLEAEMPDKCRVVKVERSHSDYSSLMQEATVVLDRLYSHSPSLNALNAMAMGKVIVAGAQPENYEFLGEEENHPIVCASPLEEDLKGKIRRLILSPDILQSSGEASRRYVERHHDAAASASSLLRVWKE